MAAADSAATVVKLFFKLKSKPRDGEILQLHHTVRGSAGEPRRIRFVTATFDEATERLACADHGGNVFVLDFTNLLFWKLSEVGPCNVMHFTPDRPNSLLVAVANTTFDVRFVDVETTETSDSLTGHTAPVRHISFSSSIVGNLLTSSPNEAIIWELKNCTKYFTLHTYKGALIQEIMFAPVTDNLVACFQNDTVQIWKHDTMKSIKQIIPSELKHMKSIAFTANGRAMVMAGLTPTLILFSLDTWKALKSVDLTKFNLSGARAVAFVPQVFDGGSNKILALLSSDFILHLFDLEAQTLLHTISPESSIIRRIAVSPNGKYFACVLKMGEVNIFNSAYVMEIGNSCKGNAFMLENGSDSKEVKKIFSAHNREESNEHSRMQVCLDGARLRRILSQYSEYPEQYRSIIWRALLNIPKNKSAYVSLVNKPIHPSYQDLEKQFTIHSAVTLKNLKRLLSCLAHWCPLFGVMRFLPGFVFPFVRVLQKDPLLLFECVASILINYCQLWFEYSPFPPINILAIIENVLGEHDKSLLDHYCKHGITNQVYALKMLETAFSEVLSCTEWLIVWDHILSNEPAFMLMAVVAYNIVQRNTLKKLTTQNQFEEFFHSQNPLDKKGFFKKCYMLLDMTSEEIHPRRYLKQYTPLDKGSAYPPFEGYPKATVCLKLAEQERKKNEKQLSLKELTARSQERQLSERYGPAPSPGTGGSATSSESSYAGDDFRSGDEEKGIVGTKQMRNVEDEKSGKIMKDRSHGDQPLEKVPGKEISEEKKELKCVTSPCKSGDIAEPERRVSRQSAVAKKKKKKRDTSKYLEKEVEKLMKKLSESEVSFFHT